LSVARWTGQVDVYGQGREGLYPWLICDVAVMLQCATIIQTFKCDAICHDGEWIYSDLIGLAPSEIGETCGRSIWK